MKIYVCVDDTDDLTKDISTGKIAEYLAELVEKHGGIPSGITRHQLLLHPDVPYTSHNSSMAFYAEIGDIDLDLLISEMKALIIEYSKPDADPGLAVCVQKDITHLDDLLAFGFQAKKVVLVKEQAYSMAKKANVFLVELGGTGQGVIGALAGIGLRISGMDGTFRGQIEMKAGTYSVRELLQHPSVDFVCTEDNKVLNQDDLVIINGKIKPSLWNHKLALVVHRGDDGYFHRSKHKFSSLKDTLIDECEYFTEDNDYNECTGEVYFSCLNCLYRRNTAEGIECVHIDSSI